MEGRKVGRKEGRKEGRKAPRIVGFFHFVYGSIGGIGGIGSRVEKRPFSN